MDICKSYFLLLTNKRIPWGECDQRRENCPEYCPLNAAYRRYIRSIASFLNKRFIFREYRSPPLQCAHWFFSVQNRPHQFEYHCFVNIWKYPAGRPNNDTINGPIQIYSGPFELSWIFNEPPAITSQFSENPKTLCNLPNVVAYAIVKFNLGEFDWHGKNFWRLICASTQTLSEA